MSRAGIAVLTAVGALALVTPAAAGAQQAFDDSNVPSELTGGVTATWRANPVTCAAHGLCGLSGTVTVVLAGTADAEVTGTPGHGSLDFIDVYADRPGAVRVRRDGPGGPAVCVDSVAPDEFLGISSAANGRVALPLETPDSGSLLPNGRCAGPVASDMPAAIVSRAFDMREVGSKPVTVDLSGRTPLRGADFTGEVVSTLKVRIGRAHLTRVTRDTGSSPFRPPARSRGPRRQVVGLEYDIDGASGALTAAFAGVPGPGCAPLDACGASGSLSYALARLSGGVLITASRRVRGNGGGLGFGLLALRQGRMRAHVEAFSDDTEETPASSGTASARVTLPDGTVCDDSVSGPAPALDARRSRSGALRVELGSVDQGGNDSMRTRCPGPLQADLSGGGVLAAGTIDTRTLGQQRLDVPLRAGGALVGPGYAGSRSGEIVLHLRLRRADAGVIGR